MSGRRGLLHDQCGEVDAPPCEVSDTGVKKSPRPMSGVKQWLDKLLEANLHRSGFAVSSGDPDDPCKKNWSGWTKARACLTSFDASVLAEILDVSHYKCFFVFYYNNDIHVFVGWLTSQVTFFTNT